MIDSQDTVAAAVSGEAALVKRRQATDSGDVWLLEFELARGERSVEPPRPGQFYQVRCGDGREHLLPRPLSVHDVSPWEGPEARINFLVERVGWGTRKLCSLETGDRVGMLGPLGKPFELPAPGGGQLLLVAGGLGVAPLYFLARELDGRGMPYGFIAGFKRGDQVYHELGGLGGSVAVATEDGRTGGRGTASDAARMMIERSREDFPYSALLACGPEAMMRAAAGLAEEAGIPCQVSLVARMACGVGACRGCVREGRGGRNLCVCKDGPVFDSAEVVWLTAGEADGPVR
jgi:dihydroorotate dehydrogenase electron transfer subunit